RMGTFSDVRPVMISGSTTCEANISSIRGGVRGGEGDDPEDISVLTEGVKVITDLGFLVLCYLALDCLDPPELKCTFEVLQKITLNLDEASPTLQQPLQKLYTTGTD
uniref:Uncharacterized protein n=1 Tax=Seriola dumerili TaxID=41447 RepID=A0A3B4T829_SERDU